MITTNQSFDFHENMNYFLSLFRRLLDGSPSLPVVDRDAEDHGQRRRLLWPSHALHFHLQVFFETQ